MRRPTGRCKWLTSWYVWFVVVLLSACDGRLAVPTDTDEIPVTRPASSLDEPTLSWWRDGGIAGFCDGLAIWDAELVAVASCELGDLDRQSALPLPQEHKEQIESWVEEFASFEWEQSDPPQASDRLRITLVFNGRGDAVATPADKEAMLAFVTELFVSMNRSS
jgi:hypothetical protein